MVYIIGAFILFFVVSILIVRSRYVKCPEDKIMVIYGKASNPNEPGPEVIAGGAKFIYPVVQDYEFIDLSEYNIDFEEHLITKDQVKLNLTVNIKFSVSNAPDIMNIAAERLVGKSRSSILEIGKDIIYGVIRISISIRDIVDIALNYKNNSFIIELISEMNKELNKVGLSLISIKVDGIKDVEGQIVDLENEFNERVLQSNITDLENDIGSTQIDEINLKILKNAEERKDLLDKKIELLVKLRNKGSLQ